MIVHSKTIQVKMKEENLQAICFTFIISVAVAQCCLQTNSGNGLPNFMDYGGQQIARPREYHQAIVPSYKFNCCGIITEWGVDVHRGAGNEIEYELNLQVWRPSPTVKEDTGTGSYSLVGSNSFSSISPRDGVAKLPLDSTQTPVSFQFGDVLGLYVKDTGRDSDGVVMLNSERELVWYARVEEHSTSSVYLVGDNGQLDILTSGAPVISIATSK